MVNEKQQEPLELGVAELATMLPEVVNAILVHGVRYIVTRRKMPVMLLGPIPEELMCPDRIPIPGRKKTEAA